MIEPTIPKEGTRKRRVLDVFLKLDGAWITSQRLDREYGFTQIHARMKELKEAPYWPIERSKTTNEDGFYSYRIVQEVRTLSML
jgi:hypothetical protein